MSNEPAAVMTGFLLSARSDQFSYQPSLLNAPDLPSWIHYTYSKRDHHGFLYGVAPKDRKYFQVNHAFRSYKQTAELSERSLTRTNDGFQLEIVGLNKHTYETRYKVLDMNVLEKENLTKYEVHLKIDNLNVEDMFDRNRTEELLDIFRSVDKTEGKSSLDRIFDTSPYVRLSFPLFFLLFPRRKRLWKDATDLYVTFLASAVDLGARLPLKPSEGEG